MLPQSLEGRTASCGLEPRPVKLGVISAGDRHFLLTFKSSSYRATICGKAQRQVSHFQAEVGRDIPRDSLTDPFFFATCELSSELELALDLVGLVLCP